MVDPGRGGRGLGQAAGVQPQQLGQGAPVLAAARPTVILGGTSRYIEELPTSGMERRPTNQGFEFGTTGEEKVKK